MLKIKQLYKTFNPGTVNAKTALNGLELELKDGDFVTVIGGNGAGKSTLLNAICGVWKPDYGTIEIDGVDVTHMPEHKRAQFIGRVFQDPMKGTAPPQASPKSSVSSASSRQSPTHRSTPEDGVLSYAGSSHSSGT